ncbi:hypothetical protein [Streptomyces carpaticus]|uniref:hypothetical protein n=1 Tax=Streptomyces carpaticus TaxID=285558 RepID=UPI0031F76C1B
MNDFDQAVPAAAPAAVWDDAPPAGVFDGDTFGHIGAGGLAVLALLGILLGTRKGAKNALPANAALVMGFVASSVFAGAGGVWALPADLIRKGLSAAGVGDPSGPFGTVGLGAVALGVTLFIWFVNFKPRASAWMGLLLATVYAAAGGAWGILPAIVARITGGMA